MYKDTVCYLYCRNGLLPSTTPSHKHLTFSLKLCRLENVSCILSSTTRCLWTREVLHNSDWPGVTITSDWPGVTITSDWPGVTITSDWPGVTITSDWPGVTITSDWPGVTITSDWPGVTITSDWPGVTITSGWPGVTITSDWPGVTITSDWPGVTITSDQQRKMNLIFLGTIYQSRFITTPKPTTPFKF